MESVSLTVDPPTQYDYPRNPWMVRLLFGDARPEHRVLFRDTILKPWCDNNCAGVWWIVVTKYAYFRNESDAMLFYLRFR